LESGEAHFKMTKAVIFDLDGTLLNTLEDLADSCNKTLMQFGFEERSLDQVRLYVGNGIGKLMENALPSRATKEELEAAIKQMKFNYSLNWQNKTKPYDGIENLLKELSERKIKTAVVSNKPDPQVKELCNLYFSNYMTEETAVGEKEGIKRKPAPDSLFEVMRILEVSKEEVIYVGDSDVDIMTAKNAEVKCVSCSWGFRSENFLKENGASVIIKKPEELLQLL
jgi:phosphoglycolate phosphatase